MKLGGPIGRGPHATTGNRMGTLPTDGYLMGVEWGHINNPKHLRH